MDNHCRAVIILFGGFEMIDEEGAGHPHTIKMFERCRTHISHVVVADSLSPTMLLCECFSRFVVQKLPNDVVVAICESAQESSKREFGTVDVPRL